MLDQAFNETLRQLYEQAPCGYLLMRTDGLITRVNKTFLDWTGYARGDLEEVRRLPELLTVPGKLFYENQLAPLLRLQGFVREVALDVVRPGGPPLPVLASAAQYADAEGQPALVAVTLFEATERRRYEHELLVARRRAERLAAIVSVSDDAIVSTDQHGAIETWNGGAERLFGHPAPVALGRSLPALLFPEAGLDWSELRTRLSGGQPLYLELVALDARQERIDLSVGCTPHPGELGDLVAVSFIMRDVRERRAMERLQQEFLAMASHELRSPLAAIRLQAQLLRRQAAIDAPGISRRQAAIDAPGISNILTLTEQMTQLVDDLLLTAQIEADHLQLRLAETDLAAETRRAATALEPEARRVSVAAEAEPVWVEADPQRFGQVLANLLTNALKYAPASSPVTVQVWQSETEAHVSVADQGAGIAPDVLPHIFERFYRAGTTARQVQGLGLGLYITRQIVESHGGRISVVSAPGHGSTFTVTLPRARGL